MQNAVSRCNLMLEIKKQSTKMLLRVLVTNSGYSSWEVRWWYFQYKNAMKIMYLFLSNQTETDNKCRGVPLWLVTTNIDKFWKATRVPCEDTYHSILHQHLIFKINEQMLPLYPVKYVLRIYWLVREGRKNKLVLQLPWKQKPLEVKILKPYDVAESDSNLWRNRVWR